MSDYFNKLAKYAGKAAYLVDDTLAADIATAKTKAQSLANRADNEIANELLNKSGKKVLAAAGTFSIATLYAMFGPFPKLESTDEEERQIEIQAKIQSIDDMLRKIVLQVESSKM